MRRISVICAAVASLAAETAMAQNQVSNSNFDTVIPPWSGTAPDVTWSSVDFQGSPSSGSALLTNPHGAGGEIHMNQCAGGVTGGATYHLGGRVFIPGGQTTTGNAEVSVVWYLGSSCAIGTEISEVSGGTTTTTGSWQSLAGILMAPPTAGGALLRAANTKSTGDGNFIVHFDRLYFGPPGTTPVTLEGFSVD